MENNNNRRIGCAASNRTKIIDPNSFGGYPSSMNHSVQNEDLNISVKLSTFRRGRTTLSKEADGSNTSQTTNTISVNFIDGTNINGKKVLTTKYTDLTTVFEQGTINTETLGISNIDIDFSSAMAPQITIDFIDVRGSSIFQNESDVSDSNVNNPYAAFFQLPYPLFELEVKGYYGQPVTYCLHMIKFSSKFNSQTGNFEIKCNFIGYTYAMLSDMLVGFLRAIPFTTIGKAQFEAYNDGRDPKILDIVGLKTKVSEIEQSVQKLAINSDNSKMINSFSEGKEILDKIESEYLGFINAAKLGGKNSESEISNRFVITENSDLSNDANSAYQSMSSKVKEYIQSYNSLNIDGLNLTETDFLPVKYSYDLTIEKIKPGSSEQIPSEFTGSDLEKYKKDLLENVKSFYVLDEKKEFRAYDLRKIYDTIAKQKALIEKNLKDSNKALAVQIKDQITVSLGFEPTVRNIIEIFTGLIEVFIQTIYEVSKKAEDPSNTDRQTELEKVFKDPLTTDLTNKDYQNKKFYPWPDYREIDGSSGQYVDKYLGSSTAIDNKTNITEIAFIENLLEGFLLANQKEKEAEVLTTQEVSNWFPTNILDTRLFQSDGKFPYNRTEILDLNSLQRLMLIRGITFLGYTNDEKYLTQGEIETMAKLEANAIIQSIHPTLKNTVKNITFDDIVKTTGTINGFSRPIVVLDDVFYVYNYIFRSEYIKTAGLRVLPINGDFNDTEIGGFTNIAATKTTKAYKSDNGIKDDDDIRMVLKELSSSENFLTNYSPARITNNSNKKLLDGGIYIKFFTTNDLESVGQLVDTTVKTDSVIKLDSLKSENISDAGFNCFGGSYGIQEFKNMDYGSSDLTDLPLMYVFYDDVSTSSLDPNIFGLANTRIVSRDYQNVSKKNILKTKYDFDPKSTEVNVSSKNDYETFFESLGGKDIHSNLGKNRLMFKQLMDSADKVTFPYIQQPISDNQKDESFSLFGSKWYYLQDLSTCKDKKGKVIFNSGDYTKALLYLNTIPFVNDLEKGPFGPKSIKHLFDIRGGLIHTPRLWCAYIGGLLWWMSDEAPIIENNQIVGGGRGSADPVIWKKSCTGDWAPNEANYFYAPSSNQYFPKFLGEVGSSRKGVYNDMSDNEILKTLPNQVKESFKQVFFDFVNGTLDGYTSFDDLRSSLEITKLNSSKFCLAINKFPVKKKNGGFLGNHGDQYFLDSSQIKSNNFINQGNYEVISISTNNLLSDSLFLELKDGSNAVKKVLQALKEELIIANTGYKVWRGPKTESFGTSGDFIGPKRSTIEVSKFNFKKYFNALTSELNNISSGYTESAQKEQALNETFGGTNLNDIKLMLYRNCKNIYDKWLGGVTDANNIIFQCGNDNSANSNRSTTDLALAKKHGRTKASLIDSFRFVNRSFRDIGDELFINPGPLSEKLADSPNTSAYDVISGLLNDNKFEFVALPTFINFYDDEVLESMFKPVNMYEKPIKTCGPSFVCVYVGQKSKNLDLKDASTNYSNDGFDLRCLNGNLDPSIPKDFALALGKQEGELPYENPIPVFVVKYSQQNQNLFKDITLDQNEFSESEESIKIMQDISTKGSSTNPTLAGQNMYNVYSVRSYTAEVEMMGNAMIQPMMYFQLDNIPMFHGAYMITRVKHSIRPNHMSTNFTGVRIRAAETPIIDVADAYMALIDTLDIAGAGTASGGALTSGTFPPIVRTIIDNGGTNGNIEVGNIKLTAIPDIKEVTNTVPKERRKLIDEAVKPFTEMINAFVDFAKSQNYPKKDGAYLNISSLYRSFEYQQKLFDENKAKGGTPGAVAQPGFSNHSWGLAVDFQFVAQKTGKFLTKDEFTPVQVSAKKEGFDITYNPSLKWFLDNSYKYGFIIPQTLRDGTGVDEYWHFEYHGTSAKCLYSKLPTTYGYTPTLNKDYKPSVHNPKGKDGKEAVYLASDCDFKYVSMADGGDNGQQIDPKLIYSELKKQLNYSDEAIAGIMGNMYQESRFNPTAINKSDAGYGLVQWTNSTKTALLQWLFDNKLDKTSYINQIKYLKHELDTIFTHTNTNLKTNKNYENSTKIFYITYEAGNLGQVGFNDNKVAARLEEMKRVDNTYSKRVDFAKQFSSMIKTKKFYLPK